MTPREQRLHNINTAIERGGGIIAFARKLGVTHQAVTGWRKRCYVPVARALQIESMFGVPRAGIVAPEIARAIATPSSEADDLI